MLALAAAASLLLALAFSVRPPAVAAFTAGDNGHPTGGQSSDLMGVDATFSFHDDATMSCSDNDVQSVSFKIDYTADAEFPSGAHLIVYLSPNNGAINGNAGGDEAGYIADVESNYVVLDLSGLSGSGTLTGSVNVTTGFVADTGGILGVIANEADGTIVSNSKTNSLNCGEATPTATPTQSPSQTPSQTPSETPSQTPSQTPSETPSQTPSETPNGDTASLNIKKVNADDTSQNLNGAVFTVDGIPGTFTTGTGTYDKDGNPVPDGVNQARTRTGYFCITGLPQDSQWLVTEITPPAGYELADPAAQWVTVDNDGDCDSSDAHFDNSPVATATPTQTPEQTVAPTQTPEQTVAPTQTPEQTVAPTETPEQTVAAATGTPEQSVAAATGTPGASQPDTSTGSNTGNNSIPSLFFALMLVLSLGGLAFLNIGSARQRS
jgi:hypothetical protein